MAEWTVCPHCHLKHTRRPDAACPRCHEPIGGEPVALGTPPAADGRMPDVYDGRPVGERPAGGRSAALSRPGSTLFGSDRQSSAGELSQGARIGGAIMVANGLALMIESGLKVTMAGAAAGGDIVRPSPVAMLIDLVLGGMLLTGNPKALGWAKFRVVAGGLVLPALFFAKGESFLGGLQLAFSTGLALLLFGNAGKLRIAAGLLGTGFGLLMETVGLFALATGTAPLARLQMASGLEADPVSVVVGESCPYQITAEGDHWYLRTAEAARKDNALADRWLVWPTKDAHVLVIAEQIDAGIQVDMDKYVEVVLGGARKSAPDLKLISQDALPGGGVRLHTRGTVNGLAIESYYGLYAREPWIFQVVGFTGQRQFQSVAGELAGIVASFEVPGA